MLSIYKAKLRDIASRARWDLRSVARESRSRLRALKDSEKGRKAVLMCNGPSLNDVDLDLLAKSGAYLIGLNKINLLFDRSDLRPNCIVATNEHVIEQNADFYNETEIPLFLSKVACGINKYVKPRENIIFFYPDAVMRDPVADVTEVVQTGATVTNVALQFALHLGIREIGLVGCDHSFATKGVAHSAVKAEEVDHNHFDPRYFSSGVTWQLPDLLESELNYQRVGNLAHELGGTIYNCTEGGKLELYPRLSIEEFLK